MRKNYLPYISEPLMMIGMIAVCFLVDLIFKSTGLFAGFVFIIVSLFLIIVGIQNIYIDIMAIWDFISGEAVAETVCVRKVSLYKDEDAIANWIKKHAPQRFKDYNIVVENEHGMQFNLIIPNSADFDENRKYHVVYGQKSHIILKIEPADTEKQ